MLNSDENKTIKQIENTYYMRPILQRLHVYIDSDGLVKSLDYLHAVLLESKDAVEQLLDVRVRDGVIKDKSQARKAIVGSAFSLLVKYIFLKLKDCAIVADNIFITSNPKKHPLIENMVTIYVGEDTQKPDMDIAIYSIKNNTLYKCLILSLKTSLRERAGQTYKWKLLLEIATSDSAIKNKYRIRYAHDTIPFVGFATVNFYDEINNPQHRGMFHFFDRAFIGKPITTDFIDNLSHLPEFVNTHLI